MVVPPNVSPADFKIALALWRTAVGPDWVFTAAEDVALYRDAYSPYWGEPEERMTSAAVAPATLDQVQAVVRTANQYRIPLYASRRAEIWPTGVPRRRYRVAWFST